MGRVAALLLSASMLSVCNPWAKAAEERARAEKAAEKEERARLEARVAALEAELERRGTTFHPAPTDAQKRAELERALEKARAESSSKPRAPAKCKCNPTDPLCDCP